MITHSCLYSLLGRRAVADTLGAMVAKVPGTVLLGIDGAVETRRSAGSSGDVGGVGAAVAITGKHGRTLGPTSVSSTR